MAALQLLLGSLLLAYGAMLLPQAAPTVPPTEPAMPAKAWHNVLEAFPTTRLRWLDEQEAAVGFHGRIAIRYNTTELRRSGDWVEVSWSGVHDPHPTDMLAVYSPPDAGAANGTAPIKFANASDAADHLRTGSGSLALRLVNTRSDLRVVFVRGDTAPFVAAQGPVIRNRNPNEPTGVHLLRTRSPTELLVQWTSRDAQRPVARYGPRAGAPDFSVPATSATYTADDMCGAPASTWGFLEPGALHTAVLSGLQPGARYWYTVGSEEEGEGGFSEEFSFVAPPPPGDGGTVHILALADQGVGEVDGSFAVMECKPAADVAALTVAEGLAGPPGGGDYSLVLHAGDISYARGYSALWDAWLLQQQALAARVPYMVCQGNHERDVLDPAHDIPYHTIDSGGECGVPYTHRFPMPTSGQPDQPWYSFDHGPVHFTVMSTEHHYGPGSPQHAWLAADLAGVDRARTPWVVLVGHRPIYIDAEEYGEQGKQTTALQLQAALEHLLDAHGVDLALAGHHHSYQRTCPVVGGRCQPGRARGTVHLCIGHAGADFYNNGRDPRPQWVEYEDQLTHGYARLAANATHLVIEAVESAEGRVVDSAVLTQRRSSASSGQEQRLSLFGRRSAVSAAA